MFLFCHRVAACAVLALLAAPDPSAAQGNETCQIVRASPADVFVRRGGGPAKADVGFVLARGDRIETGRRGRTTILCDTGLTIAIGPDTAILLDRLMAPRRGAAGVRLLDGIAGFLLGRPRGGGFEVRTPSAVAAVRSTEWAMDVEGRATAAFVREGGVAIRGRSRAVVLAGGEGVDVNSQGGVGTVRTWGQARIDGFVERLGPDWRAPGR